jgi:hypothetical protein
MMDSLLELALQILENAKKNVKSAREKMDSSIEEVELEVGGEQCQRVVCGSCSVEEEESFGVTL